MDIFTGRHAMACRYKHARINYALLEIYCSKYSALINIINGINPCTIFVRAGSPSPFPSANIKGEAASPLQNDPEFLSHIIIENGLSIMNAKNFSYIIVLSLMFALALNLPVQGQTPSQVTGSPQQSISRAAQYYIGDMNELMMKVNIWGRVQKPGQYFVPSTTDLITLISVAGGPAEKSRLDNVKVVRSGAGGSEVIVVNIKKYLAG